MKINLQEAGIRLYYEMMQHERLKGGFHPFDFQFQNRSFRVVHRNLSTSTVEARVLDRKQYNAFALKRANETRHQEILPEVIGNLVILISCDQKFIIEEASREAREWLFRAVLLQAAAKLIDHHMSFHGSMRATAVGTSEIKSLAYYKVNYNLSWQEKLAPLRYREAAVICKTTELNDELGVHLYQSYGAYDILRHVISYDMMPLAIDYLRGSVLSKQHVDLDEFEDKMKALTPDEIYDIMCGSDRYERSDIFTMKAFLKKLYASIYNKMQKEAKEALEKFMKEEQDKKINVDPPSVTVENDNQVDTAEGNSQ